jgi:hypothetical protein
MKSIWRAYRAAAVACQPPPNPSDVGNAGAWLSAQHEEEMWLDREVAGSNFQDSAYLS